MSTATVYLTVKDIEQILSMLFQYIHELLMFMIVKIAGIALIMLRAIYVGLIVIGIIVWALSSKPARGSRLIKGGIALCIVTEILYMLFFTILF